MEILEEYNYQLHYKPGKMNVVADALFRIPPQESPMHTLSITTNSDESLSHGLIHSVETPINALKNQLFLSIGTTSEYQFKIIFPRIIDVQLPNHFNLKKN